ncbi:hypothetical protein [Streptococcus uberis]|uniref:hypothetical protein n=1 Tax=Streptococcus uberis TaxID=1349 RepID=UPI001FF583B6|nr:hypothetical protein [Streptococcus uberis]MCK1214193.1 hypothetical protein [Streptococcus uberis]
MKIKPFIILTIGLMLVGCSNGDKGNIRKIVKKDNNVAQTSKNSRKSYDSLIQEIEKDKTIEKYVFKDINKDGVDELIVGDGSHAGAIYYLQSGKPVLLVKANTFTLNYRSSFTIYLSGKIAYYEWTLPDEKGKEQVMQIGKNGKSIEILKQKVDIQMTEFDQRELGLANDEKENLSKLSWTNNKGYDEQYVRKQMSSITNEPSSPTSENESDSQITTEQSQAQTNQKPQYTTVYVHLRDYINKPITDSNGSIIRDGFYIQPDSAITSEGRTETGMVFQTSNGYKVDNTLILKGDEALQFLNWIRQTAPDGTTKNGLKSNYDYWVKNVKDK